MFSFRTTSIELQLDKALLTGKVACFCTHNCWNPNTGLYLYDVFSQRSNLVKVFTGRELSPETDHIDFSADELEGLDAIVVEIQDVGSRYFNYTRDVIRLFTMCARMDSSPSVYLIDHINPAGRVVEGSVPSIESDIWTPKVAHRHGLTLGELCLLYYNEIGARFPYHLISAHCSAIGKDFLPWTIAPSSDVAGLFSCELYSGGGLWNNTNITPGIGTARAYEYFGAPFIKTNETPPAPEGVLMRPCSFIPAFGRYVGERCFGYQIILKPGVQYHSLLHSLRLIRFFSDRYPEFEMQPQLFVKIADPVIKEYLTSDLSFDIVQEHIKAEEQKWIRKAKRFLLYDDAPYRIK